MEEIGYSEFQQDVKDLFKNLIIEYNFFINNKNIDNEEQNYTCYLENNYCKLKIDLVSHFPHINLAWKFYLKNTDGEFYPLEKYESSFVGIKDSEVKKYFEEYKIQLNKFKPKSIREDIKLELSYASNVINLYSKFFEGKYTFNMYSNWLNFVIPKFKDKLPSYDELTKS